MYNDNLEYAAKRLDMTLIRKANGNPFYVHSTSKSGGRVFCLGVDQVTMEASEIALDDLDLTPVPLGFFNIGGKMVFACRKPMRKDWRQGLSTNSLVLYGADKRDFNLSSLTHTILNKFPSYQEALTYNKKTRNRSMAFSRDFGVSDKTGELLLIYRKYTVGRIIKDVPVLSPDKFFLEQHLTSAMEAA